MIHNITSKDQLAGSVKNNGTIQPDKKITYDWDYDYGSGKPHAATHIGDRTFLYDLNGNQAGWDADRTGQKRRIVWDEENRIQTITDGPTSEYKYDEDTTRVIKRRPQGETFYINQWYVDAQGRNSKHVFAGTTRIATKLQMPGGGGSGGPGNVEKFQYFYHPDHLGSTSYVTDQLGQVDQHYETFAFGESWIEEATGQADKVTPYRFTGKEWDSETQLYYFGARYYDPRTSLWTAMDPILGLYLSGSPSEGVFEPRNIALASYAHQNPARRTDANGQWVGIDDLIATGGGAVAGVGAQVVVDLVKWERSSWKDYVASGVGGAVAGEALLYTGPIGSGAAGGAAYSGTSQLLNKEFSVKKFVVDTGIGALGGKITQKIGGAIGRQLATRGFSSVENGVINEARSILSSAEMAEIQAAHAAGKSVKVEIGGRVIQYEPNLPGSGMTMFGENGFLIGPEAFGKPGELGKTVLHELYRLTTSKSGSGVSADLAAQETKAAFDFAEKAAKALDQ